MAPPDESARLGTDRRSRFCQPVTASYFVGLTPRNGKLRRRDRAAKPAQTGHGDRTSADQNAEKPANSGPFLTVSGNVKNSRLDGGGRSRMRTSLCTGIPANREFYREFRNYLRHTDDMSSKKPLCCSHFPSDSLLNLSGKIVRLTGKGKPKVGNGDRGNVSVHFSHT